MFVTITNLNAPIQGVSKRISNVMAIMTVETGLMNKIVPIQNRVADLLNSSKFIT